MLVTGGQGKLARALCALDPAIDAPGRAEMDLGSYEAVDRYCSAKKPAIIIHAGAVTNKFDQDVDEGYVRSNIIGTSNVVLWAMRHNARLVYISSDYVYPSERGGYTEESVLLPVNKYAASKLGGEMAVRIHANSLIIRTSFYASLDFPRACTDQFTSRIPLADAAKAIYELARAVDLRGVINVGAKSGRSVFEIVRTEFNPAVEPCTRADIAISYIVPSDSTMDTSKYFRIMEKNAMQSKHQDRCRVCKSDQLHTYLDLGRTPLANSYLHAEQLGQPEYAEDLAIQLCLKCGLSQLTKVVHPDLMFKNYLYVSSTTRTFQEHCDELAATSIAIASATASDLVLDIASNDGCLLSKYRARGLNVVGVDPAENLAREANAAGIQTLCAYWSQTVARDLVSRFGSPKIITATNVFAHVDDVHEFVQAVDVAMARKGIFVIECPYLVDFIERNEFDTAYHEHLSYFAIHPLSHLMRTYGMEIFNLEYFKDIHGGTVRVYVSRAGDYPVEPIVEAYLAKERRLGVLTMPLYNAFAQRIIANKKALVKLIADLHGQGKTIWAYGASAKGNTLMNFFGLTHETIPVVIDDNPKKWGYYTPGSKMRITGIEELAGSHAHFLLLLAWNFEAEIVRRCKAAGYHEQYIIPVPETKITSDHH